MGFAVVESFTTSKSGDPVLNEDVVVDGPDWAVVCDGATDKSGYLHDGETGGRVTARVTAEVVAAAATGTSPASLVAAINAAYRRTFGADLDRLGLDRPSCSFVGVDKRAGVVVRVGDVAWADGIATHRGAKEIDALHSRRRAEHLHALLRAGADVDELRASDPGRGLILPSLRAQAALRNDATADLGFGAIDGTPVPERFAETWSVGASDIVVATDGYPVLLPTLAQTEACLASDLEADPLRIGAHPSTKGVLPGHDSFDDRTYLRLVRVSPTPG